MQLPQIRMESQFAQIGIRQAAGKQELRQPKAEITMDRPKADLSIQTQRAQLTIDQTQAFADANLMNIGRRVEMFAQEGLSGVMEGMQRRAQQGRELLEIENGGNAIAGQALMNGHTQMKTLGVKYIPSHFAVKIDYQPANLQIDAQANQVNIDVQVNRAEHYFERGNVDIFIEKYQQLDIDYVNIFSASV